MLINSIKRFLGKIIIPKELINNDPKVLHISDTPSFIYPEIEKLIRILKPKYIIHTGDVSDDIKLELFPWKKDIYNSNIKKLSNRLNSAEFNSLIICVGNHDDKDLLISSFGQESVFEGNSNINIDNINISFSHYIEEIINNKSDFYLFGHSSNKPSSIVEGRFYLNGIQAINIINLKTLEITSLKYPIGTDDSRQRKVKVGL